MNKTQCKITISIEKPSEKGIIVESPIYIIVDESMADGVINDINSGKIKLKPTAIRLETPLLPTN